MSRRPGDAVRAAIESPTTQRAARTFFGAVRKLEKRVLTPENRLGRRAAARRPATGAPAPADPLRTEERRLKKSWAALPPAALERYLVSGYQDPRINVQSILTRHFLVRRLFGEEFEPLMRAELEFAVELDEVVRRRAAELGIDMAVSVKDERSVEIEKVTAAIADRQTEFQQRWAEALAGREAGPLRVAELACGSANDYRSFDAYGLARFLEYHGIDLNSANIANAKSRFPDVDFRVGSILELPFADSSVDYVLAFDIFEHLSLDAGRRALEEAVRVSTKGLVISFFRMTDRPSHLEEPRRAYHFNEMSAPQYERELRAYYRDVQVVDIKKYLHDEFGYRHTYNVKAYTFIATEPT